jgi:phosphatidylglycerol lysyltransferase
MLFSESGRAFLMYGVHRGVWVALGDPVGPRDDSRELAWRFCELADEHGARPAFYEIGCGELPMYVDLGLSLVKVGEEARVPLADFSLDGGARKGLRRSLRDAERAGLTLEIADPPLAPALWEEMEGVSDAWLGERNTREKGFSLGFFDTGYLRHFPQALVRRDGRLVAFANLWQAGGREELSVDLMRYAPDAPPGVMDYLFLRLMLWGKEQGFGWFNLGIAPLSGFETRALAPFWSRLGGLVYRHGEHFYNFRGLRQYKDKFDPVWSPRYLASRGGLALPYVLTSVASLISGGLRGVLAR